MFFVERLLMYRWLDKHRLTEQITEWRMVWMTDQLTDWLTDPLIDWLTDQWIDWATDRPTLFIVK